MGGFFDIRGSENESGVAEGSPPAWSPARPPGRPPAYLVTTGFDVPVSWCSSLAAR